MYCTGLYLGRMRRLAIGDDLEGIGSQIQEIRKLLAGINLTRLKREGAERLFRQVRDHGVGQR